MANKNDLAVNTIKMLGIDMIDEAESGHPGVVLGAGTIIYSLYTNVLNVVPNNPRWINRDRFVLSNGHASALLYSMLHFAGYDITLDDLRRFRDIDSFTPGHPEVNVDLGIECSTGALGQGVANAVGIALAERYYENLLNSLTNKNKVIDYYTYVLCGDGDLQEGVSYEALSFAGKQKLNKLIVIYDYNKVQLDGMSDDVFAEEVEDRFDALNFNVITVRNGNSISEITSALNSAKKSKIPSVIIVNTTLGKDAEAENTNKIHGKPLSKNEITRLKQKYKLPLESFKYNEELKTYVSNEIINRVIKKYNAWEKEYNEIKLLNNPEVMKILNLLEKNEFKVDFDSTNYQINEKYFEEGRISNYKVMNFIAPKTKFFLGGSADLSSSTKTIIDKNRIMDAENPMARNIAFGVREHAMGAILNGMALSNLRVFGSTHLAFADYLKPAMRMSAIMNLPVTYIFTHDSITIGKDGKTHQPIEQLTMLRTIPNMITFRPCDINEIIGCWEYILNYKGPVSMVISKEKMGILKHTSGKYVKYGAYIVRKEQEKLDGIIIATGSEVEVAIRISEELYKLGIDIRVVTMPSVELFNMQNPIYEEKLLPKNVKTITLEAGSTLMWHRFASGRDYAIGIDNYASSGSKDDVLKYAHFDYNSLLLKVKKLLDTD